MRVKSSARRSDAARPAAGRSTRSVKRGGSSGARGSVLARSILYPALGGSSSGRTTDSDSVYLGSNPSPPANWKARPCDGPFLFESHGATPAASAAKLPAIRAADHAVVVDTDVDPGHVRVLQLPWVI